MKNELLRDWRVLLLIAVDLLAIFALFPRFGVSTTEFSVSDVNSSLILADALGSRFENVTRLYSISQNGGMMHGFSFDLESAMEYEQIVNEVERALSGMVPRDVEPEVRVSGITHIEANVTVTDQEAVVGYLERGLDVSVTWVQTLRDSIAMRVDRELERENVTALLGAKARIRDFETPRTLKTNLKLGIDFLGGFYYNVKPVGVTFETRADATNITPILASEFFGTRATFEGESPGSLVTLEVENPENVTQPEFMEYIVDDFFSTYPSLRKVDFNFGNRTSEVVMNASNVNALRAVLNRTLSGRWDVIEGSEEAGVFKVEGKGSEAPETEIEANVSGYIDVISYDSKVSGDTMSEVEKMIQSRSNFLGVSDLRIKRAGSEYIMVESPERIEKGSSILQPLDFEARFWVSENRTVLAFDSADVARVEHYYYASDGWAVPLTLRGSSAEKVRQIAEEVGAIDENAEVREAHKMGMYFNDVEVYNASFSEGLAATMREEPAVSFLAITGGPKENEDARKRAEELYINLEASFPTKLRTVGEGEIPPILGRDFARQVALAAAAALAGVSVVVYLRYRRPRLVLAILGVSLSEVLIILGFAVLIGWYLDLSSVAGIIAVIGTGVDHQIVITDEAVHKGRGRRRLVIATRISRAFFIIFTAAATTIIAMSPLAYVGLGRLRGFAVVTIVGVLSGILITRPAYGRIVRRVIGS
jgi:preprotein translocase subunit SecD